MHVLQNGERKLLFAMAACMVSIVTFIGVAAWQFWPESNPTILSVGPGVPDATQVNGGDSVTFSYRICNRREPGVALFTTTWVKITEGEPQAPISQDAMRGTALTSATIPKGCGDVLSPNRVVPTTLGSWRRIGLAEVVFDDGTAILLPLASLPVEVVDVAE